MEGGLWQPSQASTPFQFPSFFFSLFKATKRSRVMNHVTSLAIFSEILFTLYHHKETAYTICKKQQKDKDLYWILLQNFIAYYMLSITCVISVHVCNICNYLLKIFTLFCIIQMKYLKNKRININCKTFHSCKAVAFRSMLFSVSTLNKK